MPSQKKARGRSRKSASEKREVFWRRVLEEQKASGLGHTEFCRKNDLSVHSYFWWKREIPKRDEKKAARAKKRPAKSRRASKKKRLVPVRVLKPAPDTTGQKAAFEIVFPGGRIIRVPPYFQAASLKQLIRVLNESC